MPPARQHERLVMPLLLLTFVTGLVDAASVLGLGHVFTANMTGNVVFLGFALGGSGEVSIVASLVALAGFLCGAALGGGLARREARAALPRVLGVEIALLLAGLGVAAAAAGGHVPAIRIALLFLLAMAMGLQNAAVRRLAIPDLTTTVLTLTLTGIAADSALAGGDGPRLARRWAAVGTMLLGACAGAVLLRRGLAWTLATAVIGEGVALAAVLAQRHPEGERAVEPATS